MSYSLLLLTAGWVAGQSSYAPTTTYPSAPTPAYAPANPGCQACAQAAQQQVVTVPYSEPKSGLLGFGLWNKVKTVLHIGRHDETYTVPPGEMGQPTTGQAGSYPLQPVPQVNTPYGSYRIQPTPQVVPQGPAAGEVQTGTQVIQPEAGALQPSPDMVPQGGTGAEPPQAGVSPVAYNAAVPQIQKKFQDQVGNADDYSWITGQLSHVHAGDGDFWVLRYAPLDRVDRYGGSVVLAPAVEMRNFREGDLVCVQGEVLQEKNAPARLGGALYRANSISMINRTDPWELSSSHKN